MPLRSLPFPNPDGLEIVEHPAHHGRGAPMLVPSVDGMARAGERLGKKLYKTDVVIISDIHLGSEVCRAKELREAIKEWLPFKRLIILGDFFDDLNFSRLRKHHFGLMDDIRKLTKPIHGVRVDWIEGNHDIQAHEVIRRIIGAHVHDEMILDLYGKKYLFMHGHQFDDFLTEHPVITVVAGKVYEAVQRREDGRKKSLSRWLKKKSKGWLRVCQKVEEKAISYANQRGADFIVCGHTHYHDGSRRHSRSKIRYINTGCWTDAPSTLITIDDKGMRRHHYR